MSARLRVVLRDEEMSEIEQLALQERLTVDEWVRRTLRGARATNQIQTTESKLRGIRSAVEFSFPTGDVDEAVPAEAAVWRKKTSIGKSGSIGLGKPRQVGP